MVTLKISVLSLTGLPPATRVSFNSLAPVAVIECVWKLVSKWAVKKNMQLLTHKLDQTRWLREENYTYHVVVVWIYRVSSSYNDPSRDLHMDKTYRAHNHRKIPVGPWNVHSFHSITYLLILLISVLQPRSWSPSVLFQRSPCSNTTDSNEVVVIRLQQSLTMSWSFKTGVLGHAVKHPKRAGTRIKERTLL